MVRAAVQLTLLGIKALLAGTAIALAAVLQLTLRERR